MRRLDNHLEYERHYIADPARPVVITSIIANNVGAVRSHFERVMSVADVCRQRELREAAAAESTVVVVIIGPPISIFTELFCGP